MDNKIKVSDYIAEYLSSIGIEYVHLIFGGGAMPIQDALCKHPKFKYISYHSEAGASYGAFGYSKYTNKINVVAPTTGIASINACAGLLSAFNDSIPVLFISGDVPLKQTTYYQKKYNNIDLRQLGIQEVNIIEVVKHITKYCIFIENAEEICFELEKIVYLMTHDRPGPCWINIPSDILNSFINPNELRHYIHEIEPNIFNVPRITTKIKNIDIDLLSLVYDLKTYSCPLILAGGGIRQSNTVKEFKIFIEKYKIPFVNTFLACDLIDFNNDLCLGSIGIKGRRNANFSLYNSNLLIILGSSLTVPHIGYLPQEFAPKAKKIAIDIDLDVHRKSLINVDKIINCDLKEFFDYVNK